MEILIHYHPSRPSSTLISMPQRNVFTIPDLIYPDFRKIYFYRPSTIDPRILGIPNTVCTGFEDDQPHRVLASSRPQPPKPRTPQQHFDEIPLHDRYPQEPEATNRSETEPRWSIPGLSPGLPSPPTRQEPSSACLSEETSSLSCPPSNPVIINEPSSGHAVVSLDGYLVGLSPIGSQGNKRSTRRRHQCEWIGCQYVCALNKDLRRHHITHVKPDRANYHRCPNPGCNKSFPRADNCQRHATNYCRRRQAALQE